ncbi:ComEC/Rec2 family competence protein [Tomitella biformata]|uniref:ComEC/Rec2 family competence protein n=1 Tax=Tomitella biformata TaxID=630403 RepID=UPI0004AD3C94|nr:ComEC/Rec2 family competence protein [Tomitella biformata]
MSLAAAEIHRPLDVRLAVTAAGSWLVVALGIMVGTVCAAALAVLGTVGVVAALLAARMGRPDRRTLFLLIAAVLLCCTGFAFATALRVGAADTVARDLAGTRSRGVLTIVDDPRPLAAAGFDGRGIVLVRGDLESVRRRGAETPTTGSVLVFAPVEGWADLLPGQRVGFLGRFDAPLRADLSVATIRADKPPEEVSEPSRLQRGAGSVRAQFARLSADVLDHDGAGLLPGLVLGDVSALPEPIRDDFKAAGLTHLTAVSGSNFALVCGAVLLVVRPLGPRPAAVLTAVALVGFVIVVRPSPSVLRAAVMGLIALVALVTGRRRQAMPALAAAVLVLLAVSPALAVDAGFALSVFATAALVMIAPTWSDRLKLWGCPRGLAEVLAVAAAAHLVSIPVVAAISGQVSLVAVLANVLATPAVVPATILGALASTVGLVWPLAAEVMIRLAGPAVWWLLGTARWCAGLPGARIAVPDGWLGATLLIGAGLVATAWLASARARWMVVGAVLAFGAVWVPTHWV